MSRPDAKITRIETAERERLAHPDSPPNGNGSAPAGTGPDPAETATARAAGGMIGRLKRLVPHGVRQRVVPPLGHLRAQYKPRPLRVPSSYARETPPEPPPLISVVVPSLNHGEYLQATLDSVLDQDYPELELIVCDGGSDDQTPELLERESDRLHRVHDGPDGGQAHAINKGLSGAEGEILAWINADDLALPGSLAHVARYFAEHPDVDVVYGNRVLLNEQGSDIGVWVTPHHSADSLQWFDFIPQETAFWRRSLWERVGGIDEGYEYGFDWDLFLRFHRAGAKIVRLPRFLGAFRQHEGQKTRRGQDEAQAELDRIRARYHDRPVSLEEAQAHAEKLLIRALPHHLYRGWSWRAGGRVAVQAAPEENGSDPAAGAGE